MWRATWIALLALTVCACGFHLRGSFVLPQWIDSVFLEGAGSGGAVGAELRQALQSSGARLSAAASGARAIVVLGREKYSRRLLAVSGGAQVKDYELKYELPLTVRDGGGALLVDEALISVVRELEFDETQVLAKTAEQDAMKREMVHDAVRQIMRRLQVLAPAPAGG